MIHFRCQIFVLPVLVAGEKKLKTGEKMVPSRVVRGGLLAASTGASSLPLGFMGLLLHVIVSKTGQQLFNKKTCAESTQKYTHAGIYNFLVSNVISFLFIFRDSTFLNKGKQVCNLEKAEVLFYDDLSYWRQDETFLLQYWVSCTFIWSFPANSGD